MSRPPASLLAVVVALAALPSVATGQVSRAFASARMGNDQNSCGNILTPCQTLQGAVDQVAAGGEVIILDTGGYGPVTIVRAVTIEAPTGVEAFIHPPSGAAVVVLAGASDVVVLRGLTLSVGGVAGVYYGIAAAVHVERCVIQGFPIGILASNQGGAPVFGDLYVEDTIIRNCPNGGIDVFSASGLIRATVERCQLVGNGLGIDADKNTRTVAWNTLAAGNGVGFFLTAGSGSSEMVLESCTAVNNTGAGVQADGSIFDSPATLWISSSTVAGNGGPGFNQLNTSQFLSRTSNTVEGNMSDVAGSVSSYSAK
jgi:hypothetical protein